MTGSPPADSIWDRLRIRLPLMSHREEWERILQKIRTGEMPPKGMPRPPAAQTDALMKFVQEKWEAADRTSLPIRAASPRAA